MSKGKFLLAAVVWLVLLAIGVATWKYLLQPQREKEREEQIQAQTNQQISATEGKSRYRLDVSLGLDSFSGYAIFRSPEFRDELAKAGIRVSMIDDGADYSSRLQKLENGQLQMALFPADALVKTSAQLGRLPATIVAMIDETRGADAMVGYKTKFPNIDALNRPETRFVMVGDSPSETLTRVVMQDFDLSRVASGSMERVSSPKDLMSAYRQATPASDKVFVIWEPFVSELLRNDQMHVLVDSSRFTGYIVDTLVVSRDFVLKHEEDVVVILQAYFRALYAYRDSSKMKSWLIADAKNTGTELTESQAENLLKGIQFKNTQENLAHFGMRGGGVLHVEDILGKIVQLLIKSGTISKDPTDGKFSRLFFDAPITKLQNNNFHPGVKDELVREENVLERLTEEQWKSLVPVGTLSVPELSFARGTANLTEASRQILDELANKLRSWPQYYLIIQGRASNVGNIEANLALAAKRADAALEYLESLGVPKQRLRSIRGEASGSTGVSFVVGQLPY